ncbi:sensor domain-containing protein [Mycolicibacterium sp. CBMA 234]|nr:sensor domain-containing protein [Mycolicibacterium sp. CBMA 234]
MPITIGSNYQCVRTSAARNNVVFDNFVCAPTLSGEDATVLNGMVAKLPH